MRLWATTKQYFCKKMQIFCKQMLNLSGEHNTFVSKCKVSSGTQYFWRDNANVLWETRKFLWRAQYSCFFLLAFFFSSPCHLWGSIGVRPINKCTPLKCQSMPFFFLVSKLLIILWNITSNDFIWDFHTGHVNSDHLKTIPYLWADSKAEKLESSSARLTAVLMRTDQDSEGGGGVR